MKFVGATYSVQMVMFVEMLNQLVRVVEQSNAQSAVTAMTHVVRLLEELSSSAECKKINSTSYTCTIRGPALAVVSGDTSDS